jgi:hypothetical protein
LPSIRDSASRMKNCMERFPLQLESFILSRPRCKTLRARSSSPRR